MHKTGETLPPMINPLQVVGEPRWGGCHCVFLLHRMYQINVWRMGGLLE